MERKRGVLLTIFAVLFALLAISNFMKPLQMQPGVGFVFLGKRLSGLPNLIMGPLFGILLAAYAYGIWTMRRFALPLGYFYAAYVIVNLVLYLTLNHGELGTTTLSMVGYLVVAIGVSSGAAIILHRRRAELR